MFCISLETSFNQNACAPNWNLVKRVPHSNVLHRLLSVHHNGSHRMGTLLGPYMTQGRSYFRLDHRTAWTTTTQSELDLAIWVPISFYNIAWQRSYLRIKHSQVSVNLATTTSIPVGCPKCLGRLLERAAKSNRKWSPQHLITCNRRWRSPVSLCLFTLNRESLTMQGLAATQLVVSLNASGHSCEQRRWFAQEAPPL